MSKFDKSSKKRVVQSQSGTTFSLMTPLGVAAGAAIIVLAVFFVYLPSISGGFIWDDNAIYVTNNQAIKAPDGLYRICCTTEAAEYYPVTNATFWIEWRLWGMNTTGYHVTNVILHIIEALLIWVILRKFSIPGAFLAAIVFAVHPVNVESVAWIAERKDMLAMLFFLLAMLWYVKAGMPTTSVGMAPAGSHGGPWEPDKIAPRPTFGRRPVAAKRIPHFSSFILQPSSFYFWYWLSLLAFVIGMLSKGSIAILPALLLGVIWWFRPLTKRDWMRTALFFLVAAILIPIDIWCQTHGTEVVIRSATFTERLVESGGVVWFYLYKALLPINLIFVYPSWHIQADNLLWWLPLLAVLAVTAVLWLYRESWSRPFWFAWFFFCVALIPVMGFADAFFKRYSPVADHYQHIAIIGVITLTVAGWGIWHRRVRGILYWGTTLIAIAAVGVLSLLTWRQSGHYYDENTLFQETLEKNPGCWMAHTILGIISLNKGQVPEAIAHQRQSVGLNPDFFETQNNLGSALAQAGRTQEAIEHYQRALELNPNYREARYNLGVTLFNAGRLEEAIDQYQQALRINANFPEAQNNLGSALALAGRVQEAIEHYQRALELNPDFLDAHYNLGVTLFNAGRLEEAIDQYQQALRLKPEDAALYFNLALACAGANQSSEAIAAARKALELAQSTGQTAQAKEIKKWLDTYRAGVSNLPDGRPSSKSVPPAHY
jgi:protein O-mannosyl-transferase